MDDTRLKLMEAIARKKLVTAQYNGQTLTLAPHLLFELSRRADAALYRAKAGGRNQVRVALGELSSVPAVGVA